MKRVINVLTFSGYQMRARETSVDHANKITKLVNGLFGLLGETGEISELWKKHLFHHGGEADKRAMMVLIERTREELGDVLWYVSQIADAIDADLGEVAYENLEKLANRHITGFNGKSIAIGIPDNEPKKEPSS